MASVSGATAVIAQAEASVPLCSQSNIAAATAVRHTESAVPASDSWNVKHAEWACLRMFVVYQLTMEAVKRSPTDRQTAKSLSTLSTL
jgi:hypothetical protein